MKHCSEFCHASAGWHPVIVYACSKQTGFILIVVLLFLQAFSLLSLSSLANSNMMLKMVRQRVQKENMASTMESHLKRIEQQLLVNQVSTCIKTQTFYTSLLHADFAWWQNHACGDHQQPFQFFYVIETVGQEACTVTDQSGVADYYRITLVSFLKNTTERSGFMQTLVVKNSQALEPCYATLHHVSVGRQWWREG